MTTMINDKEDDDYDNNFGNVENKNWFNSLPLRGSKKKKKAQNRQTESPLASIENTASGDDLYR